MKNASGPIDDALPLAIVNLIHERHGHSSSAQLAAGAERFLARIQQRRQPRRPLTWAIAAAAASVTILALVVTILHRTPQALEVSIRGAHLLTGGAIESDPGGEPCLHFSDGSDIRLSAAAHAVLRHVDPLGATVSVRDGDAEVDVAHRPGALWMFEAGPFLIHVTGTAFRFVWNAATEEFDLRMQRGSVEVTGPLTDGMLVLHAGEHLVVHVRKGEVVIHQREAENLPGNAAPAPPSDTAAHSDGASEQPTPEASLYVEPVIPQELPNDSVRASTPRKPESARGDSWPALVTRGDFETVVADARRRGVEASLAREGPLQLTALADAARYTRDDELARSTLLAERRRFPGSTLAHEAAFLLGRLEETRNDSAAAIERYRRYVIEDPQGRYVAEALGRRMVLLETVSPDEARQVAEEYLRRFPAAAYAARARAIAKVP